MVNQAAHFRIRTQISVYSAPFAALWPPSWLESIIRRASLRTQLRQNPAKQYCTKLNMVARPETETRQELQRALRGYSASWFCVGVLTVAHGGRSTSLNKLSAQADQPFFAVIGQGAKTRFASRLPSPPECSSRQSPCPMRQLGSWRWQSWSLQLHRPYNPIRTFCKYRY